MYTTAPLPAGEFIKISATFKGDVLIIFRCYSSILSSIIHSNFTSFRYLYPRSIVYSSLRFSQSGPGLQQS